jgi:hypothetical protein
MGCKQSLESVEKVITKLDGAYSPDKAERFVKENEQFMEIIVL